MLIVFFAKCCILISVSLFTSKRKLILSKGKVIMNKIATAAFAGMLMSTSMVSAGDTFNGFFIGAQGGFVSQKAELKNKSTKVSSFDFSNGFTGEVLAGYNHRMDNMVVGFEFTGGKTFGSKKEEVKNVADLIEVTSKNRYFLTAGLKLGYVFAQDFMAFGKVSFNHASYDVTTKKDANTAAEKKEGNINAPQIGLGLEKSFGDLTARISYDFAFKSNVSDAKLPADHKISANGHKVMVGVVYNM